MKTNKDLDRINSIVKKSAGNESKGVQLAMAMVNSIKDKTKALSRYEAAVEILGPEDPITIVFANKATEMGHDIIAANKQMSTIKNTYGKLGSSSELKDMGMRSGTSMNGNLTSILPLGSTNLVTGKCKYFNIYDTWGRDNDTSIELWNKNDDPSGKPIYALIFTSGKGPIYKIGTENGFQHDQNMRFLFGGKLVDWANIGDAELLIKKYNIKSVNGYVYK